MNIGNPGTVGAGGAGLSVDPNELNALKQSARQNSPEALKTVARQFEGLFMNMIMKSMRAATPQDGIFDSEQSKMFTSMLDQQMSQNLAKRGVGLADVLIRQLSNGAMQSAIAPAGSAAVAGMTANAGVSTPVNTPANVGTSAAATAVARAAADPSWQQRIESALSGTLDSALGGGIPGVLQAVLGGAGSVANAGLAALGQGVGRSRESQPPHIRAFEDKLGASAKEAALSTGIPAKFMLGQAALESGWGKREILTADGSSSHNVFGIKAGASWKGKVTEAVTTEYVNGVPERRVERFRAYDSYGEAFKDYAKTLSNNPRYQAVLSNAKDLKGFAEGLQRAGYATDPNYAAKLTRIITHSLSL